MFARTDMHRVSMAMVLIFAMIAVLLPLCAMVQCDMSPMQMAGSQMGLGFSSACANTMTSAAQAAVAPGNLQTLIMMLVVAMGMVFALTLPQASTRLVRIVAEEPPPPPEDPRGARFIV